MSFDNELSHDNFNEFSHSFVWADINNFRL